MRHLLAFACIVSLAFQAHALRDMREATKFAPLNIAKKKTVSETKYVFERMSGIVCKRLDALKFVYRSLLKEPALYKTIRVANRRYKYSGCSLKVDVAYTQMFIKEIEYLPGGFFVMEYHGIFLEKIGFRYTGKMVPTVPILYEPEATWE